MLKEAAAAWSAQLRPGDTLARYGGDEFVVLLRGLDLRRRTSSSTACAPPPRAGNPARRASCSASRARRRGSSGRADQALYEPRTPVATARCSRAEPRRESGGRDCVRQGVWPPVLDTIERAVEDAAHDGHGTLLLIRADPALGSARLLEDASHGSRSGGRPRSCWPVGSTSPGSRGAFAQPDGARVRGPGGARRGDPGAAVGRAHAGAGPRRPRPRASARPLDRSLPAAVAAAAVARGRLVVLATVSRTGGLGADSDGAAVIAELERLGLARPSSSTATDATKSSTRWTAPMKRSRRIS